MTSTNTAAQPADDVSAALAHTPQGLESYAQQVASGGALLGYIVLYSVCVGEVTPQQVEQWFVELGLDRSLLPPSLRPIDAFEKITGPDGVQDSYSLADPTAVRQRGERRRRAAGQDGQIATLMVRPVRTDNTQLVRHVVREVRDQGQKALSYDSHLAEVIFHREGGSPGGGRLQVIADNAAIGALPAGEQTRIRDMLTELSDSYRWHCTYLGPDRLRAIVRKYIEQMGAVKVRQGGGVYFVRAEHTKTLQALTQFVGRVGEGSHFVEIPLPNQAEMRDMVIAAFTTKARDEANKLALDIAAAKRKGDPAAAAELHRRFTTLKQSASQYQSLLSNSLDEAGAALDLVQVQLASLLAQASDAND
ncbi:DUF6744 family protein [Nocardia vinacea]|uniref:DUF6744 family protein n=1 Tax=Nocardia vinacea TaxID=96468 RepID=UPI00342F08ED